VNILEAIRDPNLLGASLALATEETWAPWRTFLATSYGLPMGREAIALYRRATGRDVLPPEEGFRETVCVVGRQAGKTRIGALIAAFEAAFAPPCAEGELYALLLAQDHRAALRAAFSYVRALFEASPVLRRSIVSETSDTLTLENGLRVAAYPCRPAAVRGLRARVVVLDELAFFRSGEGLAVDTETLRAVRPTLATTGGRLVILSSPYAQTGALWELHKRHYGQRSGVLVWQADAPTMNPTLPADYLARMQEDDPEAYRSEVLGEFRAGVANLLDPEVIDACVVPGRRELAPESGTTYEAFADPSGGRRDAFTLSIAHRAEGRCRVDVVRAWKPPLNPAGVVAEASALLRTYRLSRVTGDRYAGEWPVEAFRSHGVTYLTAEKDRSALYLELVAHVNAKLIELPDVPELLRELRLLERRRGSSGRDRVDHPRGAHDDRANAVAGVAALVIGRRERPAYGFKDIDTFSDVRSQMERDRGESVSWFDDGSTWADVILGSPLR